MTSQMFGSTFSHAIDCNVESYNKVVICGYEDIRESVNEGITRIVTMSNIMRKTVLASLVSNIRSTMYVIYSIETVQVR